MKTIAILNYLDLPYFDTIHYTVSKKKTPQLLLAPLPSSKETLSIGKLSNFLLKV